MDSTYSYRSTATWTTAREGQIAAEGVPQPLAFSAPPEFQGRTGVWTPEHFLVAATAACFVTTFRAIAEFSKFEIAGLEVASEGTVAKGEGGFSFTRIVLRPRLTVLREQDRERGSRLLEKAERACLVSRSLRSEVAIDVRVDVAAPTLP